MLLFWCGRCEVLSQPVEAQRSPNPGIMPQGPREGTFALGECETSGRRVQVRPPAGCGATRVGCDEPGPGLRTLMILRVRPCDDPQQLTLGGSLSTSDARPYGTAGARANVEL